MLRRPTALAAPLVAALALLAAGCGSGSDRAKGATAPPQPAATAKAADFPQAGKGATLQDILSQAAEGPILAPAVSVLTTKHVNRFGFGLFDTAQKQIPGAQVVLYTARQDGTGVKGPYVARSESLEVDRRFLSRTSAADPDAAKSVYVADVPFKRKGINTVTALVRLDGRMLRTTVTSVKVDAKGPEPPDVGDKAIKVHTPTLADVANDASKIDTRTPPATDLLTTDLADVVGKQPVVITFATPLLCQSRVCGPVVDVVEQVKSKAPKDVAFIHQEIYKDNKTNNGVTDPVAAWRLHSEPWTYVIDKSGKIAARFEGAFSAGELQHAVAKVTGTNAR